ncbi:glycosyltransferase family 4 protein [Arthrobacter sp. 179]|uniref:glycosyltransferase family 4 protein n=1 Tax=Arthrobacter sp. 179 TaxID=3457734 RepID=UPI004033DFE6
MRLMLVTHSYWPESTPPQRRWMAFIQVFREQGWHVDVVAPHPSAADGSTCSPRRWDKWGVGAQAGPSGESIRRLPSFDVGDSRAGRLARHCLTAAMSVPRALFAPRPDVIVVTIPSLPHIVAGWMIAKIRRRPLVVEMRDAWPDLVHDSRVSTSRVTTVLDAVMTGVQHQADLVVTVTQGFRQQLEARGIKRAVTVHNGISAERLPQVDTRREHEGPLRVLYMGNHGESQGLDVVVRAVAMVGDTVDVRFVGGGTAKQRLENLASSLDASIDFVEGVDGQSLVQHYEWADTCVVALRSDWPSFRWTIPSKTYELMATGRHITAVLRGEAATLIETNGAGDVVAAEPRSIARLWMALADDHERLASKKNGQQWVVEHANMRDLAHRYMDFLGGLAVSHNGRRG